MMDPAVARARRPGVAVRDMHVRMAMSSSVDGAVQTATDYLEVRDPADGAERQLPIKDRSIRATDVGKIRQDEFGDGLLSYDPAFMNTASCRSAITYLDGERGILRYRGYPIQDLAGKVSFLDVAWLLIHGELPTPLESNEWAQAIVKCSRIPEPIRAIITGFPRQAHPMAVMLSAWSALGAYHPDSKRVDDPEVREAQFPVFLGAIRTITGMVFRHRVGISLDLPAPEGNFACDFLATLFANDAHYAGHDTIADALDILFVLQADHEQNCSTNAVRAVGSSRVDPYSAIAAGIAALYGPLHGGANEAVVRQLHEIGTVENVPGFIDRVKKGERRLMGFGHRVYKTYDPRAAIIKETTRRVFDVTGTNPLLDVALAVEDVALHDDYFVSRHLYPNVDFYSGLIYEAMGLPMDSFTMLFVAARMAGWIAQWQELIVDPEQKIARPRQLYVGPAMRSLT